MSLLKRFRAIPLILGVLSMAGAAAAHEFELEAPPSDNRPAVVPPGSNPGRRRRPPV